MVSYLRHHIDARKRAEQLVSLLFSEIGAVAGSFDDTGRQRTRWMGVGRD